MLARNGKLFFKRFVFLAMFSTFMIFLYMRVAVLISESLVTVNEDCLVFNSMSIALRLSISTQCDLAKNSEPRSRGGIYDH